MGRNGGTNKAPRTQKQEYMFRFAMRKRAQAIRRGEVERILCEVSSEEENMPGVREEVHAQASQANLLRPSRRVREAGA